VVDYVNTQHMKSSQGEAVKHIYNVHRGKSGKLWLVACNIPNSADHVYVQGNANSNGFGGAKLEFDIGHEDSISLKGAWKTGAENLYKDTGIDIRDLYLGTIVVGRSIERPKPYTTVVKDVVFQETGLGSFPWHRAKEKAQELANELGEKLYYYGESEGGASSHFVEPEEVTND